MKLVLGAAFALALCAGNALAGHFGGPGFRDFGFEGHRGPNEGFGGLGRFGGLGIDFALGTLDPERQQTRFEQRFESLQTQYDTDVTDISDFFSSDEYDRIIGRTESLVDRYGLFLSGVQHSADRLTDIIGIANDDLNYYDDLLADYQANTDLSADRFARIERWITSITDRLDSRIDFLTNKQTTLQENLPTYRSFQTELSTFLDDIVAAGAGTTTDSTTGTTSSLLGIAATSRLATLASAKSTSADAAACAPAALGNSGAVPEPASLALVLSAIVVASGYRRRFSRRI